MFMKSDEFAEATIHLELVFSFDHADQVLHIHRSVRASDQMVTDDLNLTSRIAHNFALNDLLLSHVS